ncbi:MAG: hypothetical protein ACKPKO_13390, partial [Candidatus Fonsibacter sp.]
AADAQHLATELLVRLRSRVERPSWPAIALTLDPAALTAGGNDYGFDHSTSSHPTRWGLTYQHVELVVKFSNNSSPGPDGIPYGAWRQLGHLGVVAIHAVGSRL